MVARKDARSRMIARYVAFGGSPFMSAAQRIQRGYRPGSNFIAEDDPRWNPRRMGNRRYRSKGFIRQG